MNKSLEKKIFTEEQVAVVPTEILHELGADCERIIEFEFEKINQILINNLLFVDRNLAESDYSLKQIIPYNVIEFNDCIFETKRSKKQNEYRLHDKFSIGVGGHINSEDIGIKDDIIIRGQKRELSEEVNLGKHTSSFIGIINDDSTDVGMLHFGLCFLIKSKDGFCEVLETNKMTGEWKSPDKIIANFDLLEEWSQIAIRSMLEKRMITYEF